MPLYQDQLDTIVRDFTLTFPERPDQSLYIRYIPARVSEENFDMLRRAVEAGEFTDDVGSAPVLAAAIIDWDFCPGEGHPPFPITIENVSKLGYGIQTEVARKMVGAPDPTNLNRSNRRSYQGPAKVWKYPTGTPDSQQVNTGEYPPST